MPIRKNHGSISSTDSGHSEAMGYCEGNVYQLTSSILHNAPTIAAPPPPRRHSAVQQGSNSSNLYPMQPNTVNSSSTKQANGDISSMPPPTMPPRTRAVPFPIAVPVLTGTNVGPGYIYASQQQQFSQLRHVGMCFTFSFVYVTTLNVFLTLKEWFHRRHQETLIGITRKHTT